MLSSQDLQLPTFDDDELTGPSVETDILRKEDEVEVPSSKSKRTIDEVSDGNVVDSGEKKKKKKKKKKDKKKDKKDKKEKSN